MTELRKAAEMALSILTTNSDSMSPDDYDREWFNAIFAIREALAQQDRKYEAAHPYAELKDAAKDPTKQIRLRGAKVWVEGDIFVFDEPPENYEIRDKPKNVKLRAYIDGVSGELLWRLEGHNVSSYWKRVPSEDKEVEIEP